MKLTDLTVSFRSAHSAYDIAKDLKEKFQKKSDSNPAEIHQETSGYSWLPQIPAPKYMANHLASLELEQAVLNIFKYIQQIRIPIEELEIDNKNDGVLGLNISNMRGSLDNTIEELNFTLKHNNLQTDIVDSSIMPDNLKNLDKTNQALRDWLIIRTLFEILEYTIQVFEYFKIPLE